MKDMQEMQEMQEMTSEEMDTEISQRIRTLSPEEKAQLISHLLRLVAAQEENASAPLEVV